jgi:hypothetical protein
MRKLFIKTSTGLGRLEGFAPGLLKVSSSEWQINVAMHRRTNLENNKEDHQQDLAVRIAMIVSVAV